MADITLAEFNGRVWVVGGEAHIDDLLANTLNAQVSIEMVPCESQEQVMNLWAQHCGQPEPGSFPCLIHPKIADRIRRRSPNHAVFFAQWSALLDQDALTVIRAAAIQAAEHRDVPVILAEYFDPDGPSAIAELSRLRAQLIEDKLAENGVDRTRLRHTRRDVIEIAGMGQESQRVDIIVRPP